MKISASEERRTECGYRLVIANTMKGHGEYFKSSFHTSNHCPFPAHVPLFFTLTFSTFVSKELTWLVK